MRYWTTIGDREYELTVEGEGSALAVTLDGKPCELDYFEVARGAIYSLILDGNSYELWVRRDDGGFVVFVAGQTLKVAVEDERQRRVRELTSAAGIAEHAAVEVKAPMPAVVLEVMVAPGDEVKAGQGLCVIEAMKMENLMRSPQDGTVTDVKVEKGQGVSLNDVLVVIS
ncbi:MAG: hypothetical protein PVH29_00755 [Candidatus Zixiibacteriota bacterium]|jgi:pyruvate carboxylase subunit B